MTRTQLNYGAPNFEVYAAFFCRIPLVPRSPRIHAARGRPGIIVAEDIFYGSSQDWKLDCTSRPISFQDYPATAYAAQKCRRTQQEDQRLHELREDYRKVAGNEPGIQLHVSTGLRILPTVPYIDKHGRLIPCHPELPAEARVQLPVLCLRSQEKNHWKTNLLNLFHGIRKCNGKRRPLPLKMSGPAALLV